MGKIQIEVTQEEVEDYALEMAEHLLDEGLPLEVAIETTADLLDKLIPFDIILPGLPGALLEEVDGDVFESVLKWVRDLLKRDPEKKAARQAFRESIRDLSPREKRAARKARRGAE